MIKSFLFFLILSSIPTQARIINGEKVLNPKTKYSYAVAIYKKENLKVETKASFHCSGTLISSHLILTAGHCVYDNSGLTNKNLFSFQVGDEILETEAVEIFVHDKYIDAVDSTKKNNKKIAEENVLKDYLSSNLTSKKILSSAEFLKSDIALILIKPLKKSQEPSVYPLLSWESQNVLSSKVQLLGYGQSSTNPNYSYNDVYGKLRTGTATLEENNLGIHLIKSSEVEIDGKMFFNQNISSGIGPGDSGGPLLSELKDQNRPVIIGVNSTVYTPSTNPQTIQDIGTHLNFIESKGIIYGFNIINNETKEQEFFDFGSFLAEKMNSGEMTPNEFLEQYNNFRNFNKENMSFSDLKDFLADNDYAVYDLKRLYGFLDFNNTKNYQVVRALGAKKISAFVDIDQPINKAFIQGIMNNHED